MIKESAPNRMRSLVTALSEKEKYTMLELGGEQLVVYDLHEGHSDTYTRCIAGRTLERRSFHKAFPP